MGDAAASAPALAPAPRVPGAPAPVLSGVSSCAPRRSSSPRPPARAAAAALSGADLAPLHRPCCSVGDAAACLPAASLNSDEYCPGCRLTSPAASVTTLLLPPLMRCPTRGASADTGSGAAVPDWICQLGLAAAVPMLSLLSLSAVVLPLGSAAALRPGLLPSLPARLKRAGLPPAGSGGCA